MNYRHCVPRRERCRLHVKHALLVWLLDALQKQAGAGVRARYPCRHRALRPARRSTAERTGEWRDGIARLLHEPPAPLAALCRGRVGRRAAIEPSFIPARPLLDLPGLLRDGGPPRLLRAAPGGPSASPAHGCFAGDERVGVHLRGTATSAIRALLPPKETSRPGADRSAVRGAGRVRALGRRAARRARRASVMGFTRRGIRSSTGAPVTTFHEADCASPGCGTPSPPSCGYAGADRSRRC